MPAEGLGFRVWAFQHRDEQKNSRRITVEEGGDMLCFMYGSVKEPEKQH